VQLINTAALSLDIADSEHETIVCAAQKLFDGLDIPDLSLKVARWGDVSRSLAIGSAGVAANHAITLTVR
jgi:hypothetical protein